MMRVGCVIVVRWIVVTTDQVVTDEAEMVAVGTMSLAPIHCRYLHTMTPIPAPL